MKLKPTTTKARRTLIEISQEIQLEGYLMPDGQYTLNPTSLTKAIRKHRTALLQFLKGKSPQAQSCQGFSLLQIEEIAVDGGGSHSMPEYPFANSGSTGICKRQNKLTPREKFAPSS